MRRVRVPGDKSITHRALLFAAVANGVSRIANVQAGGDAHSTAGALRALGRTIPALPDDGAEIVVRGDRLHCLTPPDGPIDCGNSGTGVRLLMGVLAGQPFRAVLTGDASLLSRPMRRVTRPLARMGVRFDELGEPDRLPIAEHGAELDAIDYASPHASAQVKSAVLLAGLTGGAAVRVREPVLSRDHTERMLAAMGVTVRTGRESDGAAVIDLEPIDSLEPLDLRVPGDFSAAAFFLAFGLLSDHPVRVDGVGLNPTRIGWLEVLHRMGGRIAIENVRTESGEPVGDIIAEPSRLIGTTVTGAELPSLIDEVPMLAVMAALADGETRIEGASELRVKETDRIAALATNLSAIGAAAIETPDGLIVRGATTPLSGSIDSFGDHRIAMAFGVLATLPDHHISITAPAVAAVSFPGFWDELKACAAAAAA